MEKTSPHATTEASGSGSSGPLGQVLLAKYRLHRELGRGGMGIVYAAEHLMLGQQVAIKMMLPHIAQDPAAVARFLNEGRAAARLENEHVARVMDVELLRDGTPFLVLELLEGLDLAEILHAGGPLHVARAVDYLLEAMEAIAEAHSAGIVHRDLKPSNLFLAERKGGTILKVLDFGISKALAADPTREQVVTATNAILGSPAYMSPEQLRNVRELDARADIWSLGVIAYELLTGTLPYSGPNVVELFAAISERDPRPVRELRPHVPAGVDDAILRSLRRAPADRWPSVLDLATALAPHGSPAARASLSRIQMVLAEPISAPPPAPSDHTSLALPRTRISVPDTDPNDLPSTTMLAGGAPMSVPLARSTVSGVVAASSFTRTTGASEAKATASRTRRGATIAVAAAGVLLALGAIVLRRSPAPSEAPTASVRALPLPPPPAEPSSSQAAVAPTTPPPAVASAPVAVTATSASLAPSRVAPTPKPASSKASRKGVPADWN